MSARRTRQLAAVYAVVRAAHDHPTAEDVHRRVRRRLPRVSLGTVYRNLQKLAVQRQVRVVQLADRAARYDGMLSEHDHFVCERCGAVTDLLRHPAPEPRRAALRHAGYVVRAHALTYYGLCPDCGGAKSPPRSRRGRTPGTVAVPGTTAFGPAARPRSAPTTGRRTRPAQTA